MKRVFCLAIFACFSFLLSCDEPFDPATPAPNQIISKEVHFNFETGEKFGEKSFTYDSKGLLSLEYYTSESSDYFEETRYEYDGNGNLLKMKIGNLHTDGKYFVVEFTYENGLKTSEKNFYEGSIYLGPRVYHYYTGNKMDSSHYFFYDSFNEQYVYGNTSYYEYDSQGRMNKESYRDSRGFIFPGYKIYRYEYDNLTQTCNVAIDGNGGLLEWCVVNGYNLMGQLARVSEVSPWRDQLNEELFYKAGRLHEKKVYTYPAYDPQNTIDVTLIKYEYF